MRVVAGEFGGRRLRAPAGRTTRPTGDRVREAVFSMLGTMDHLVVLDLYAGSGAMGIEALSRGAVRATFAERDPRAVAALRANLATLGIDAARAAVVSRDAAAVVRSLPAASIDVCLIDPPYDALVRHWQRLHGPLAEAMRPGGRIVIEGSTHHPDPAVAPPFEADRRARTYGSTRITMLRVTGPPEDTTA